MAPDKPGNMPGTTWGAHIRAHIRPPTPGAHHPTHQDRPGTTEAGMTARVCSTPRCPNLLPRGAGQPTSGRCPTCRAQADRKRRPDGSVYGTAGHKRFREQVLARDPVCVLCRAARATVADHHPTERVDLIEQGLDPNDPEFGQGLCKQCHDSKTASTYGFGGSH